MIEDICASLMCAKKRYNNKRNKEIKGASTGRSNMMLRNTEREYRSITESKSIDNRST